MDNKYLTLQEASAALGVTQKTLSSYISRGHIRCHKKSGTNRKWVVSDDVIAFADARSGSEVFDMHSFRMLKGEVRKLSYQLDSVCRILDVDALPLGMESGELFEFYSVVDELNQISPLPEEAVSTLVPILMRVAEDDFRVLEGLGVDTPWAAFLQLVRNSLSDIVSDKRYKTSLDLQSLHREVAECRRRIRQATYIHAVTKGTPTDVKPIPIMEPESVIERIKKMVDKPS